MHIAVVGAGLVGRRCADLLIQQGHRVLLVGYDRRPNPVDGMEVDHKWASPLAANADVVVVATASSRQVAIARSLVGSGADVVLTADDVAVVQELWSLGSVAAAAGQRFVVGAAYSPGLSSLLVRSLALRLDEVTAIATAQFGTGGPACARQHHRAMGSAGLEVYEGELRPARGGSGRQLVWFPDPVGAVDCYRAGLPEPWLLHQAFPAVRRIESRQAATRRDRLTTHLPMLRPPHPEGLLGAVWVEVRGRRDGQVEHLAMAATAPQATGAAAMVSAACEWLDTAHTTQGDVNLVPPGVVTTADCVDPAPLLRSVTDTVRLWAYDGSQIVVKTGVAATQQIARKRSHRPNR